MSIVQIPCHSFSLYDAHSTCWINAQHTTYRERHNQQQQSISSRTEQSNTIRDSIVVLLIIIILSTQRIAFRCLCEERINIIIIGIARQFIYFYFSTVF